MQFFDFLFRAEKNLRSIVNRFGLNVEDIFFSVSSSSIRLTDDERGRIAFVQQPQLAVGRVGVIRVQKDATVHECAVEVGDEGADVTLRNRRLALLFALDEPLDAFGP